MPFRLHVHYSLCALLALSVGALRPARADGGPAQISFVNDVVPALTRAGCNQGSCHGAAAGKNGFKLSLRGYAPELDYLAITRDRGGRRICTSASDTSLLLRKPLLLVPHGGGRVLDASRPEYAILRRWIASGAPGPSPHDPALVHLTVEPGALVVEPGQAQHIRVLARFSDGSTRDATYWARYSSNDENVVTTAPNGSVMVVGHGETVVPVAYQSLVSFARFTSPFANAAAPGLYAHLPRSGYVDDLVYAKLRAMRLVPSPPAPPAAFVRRLYLDLIGTLPAPEEVRAFAADSAPGERERLVDRLMARPEFADYWTYILCDLLRVNRGALKDKGMWAFYAWVHRCVVENRPWTAMTNEILTSTGDTFRTGAANYFRTARTATELAENVSQGFLGVRIQCAKCHNHPLERWTQNAYYGMANLFARVGRKVDDAPWVNESMVVYNEASGDVLQPRLGRPVPPEPLGGAPMPPGDIEDRRAYLAAWMTSPKNWLFSHAIVNRIWAHFMGRGLVEPVDDLRETNPATNPALFDRLTRDFVSHGFDLRYLMRRIVTSEVYGLSSTARPLNRQDDHFYSRYYVRRLAAEPLLDALSAMTGEPEQFAGMPGGTRAIDLPDTHVASAFLDGFGRPARQITCECERDSHPDLAQALLFLNSETVNRKVTADGGIVDRLIASGAGDAGVLDALYCRAFGRPPTAAERKAELSALRSREAAQTAQSALIRRQAFQDLLWALVNSKEFLFNH